VIVEEKNNKTGDGIVNASALCDCCELGTKLAAGLMQALAKAAPAYIHAFETNARVKWSPMPVV
jgi:hypothetical protein